MYSPAVQAAYLKELLEAAQTLYRSVETSPRPADECFRALGLSALFDVIEERAGQLLDEIACLEDPEAWARIKADCADRVAEHG
jgi:hypothetical protein